MKEILISFETAKLAKEKGFNISLYNFYYKKRNNSKPYLTKGIEYNSEKNCKWDWNSNGGESGTQTNVIPYPNKYNSKQVFSAPTQSLLQKWLREKYNIHVYPVCLVEKQVPEYEVYVYERNKFSKKTYINEELNYTYEEALEKGLYEALMLII